LVNQAEAIARTTDIPIDEAFNKVLNSWREDGIVDANQFNYLNSAIGAILGAQGPTE
jgi:hypothetical protein